MTYYTLVQHSGFFARGDATFAFAVETHALVNDRKAETTRQVMQILEAGGVVFGDYGAASNYEETENYPSKVEGLVPRVEGTFRFVDSMVEPVYVPTANLSEAASNT